MPAVSKKQQRFFALVQAAKRGDIDKSKVSDKVERAADSMSEESIRHFAATKRKGLPERVKKASSPLDYMFVRGFLSRLAER